MSGATLKRIKSIWWAVSQAVQGSSALLVTVQLRGSADGLNHLHSQDIVHGSGKSGRDLTFMHDLTYPTVKCVSFSYLLCCESPLTERT